MKAYRRSGGRTVYGRPSQKVRAVTDAADPTCEESIYSTYADSEGFCTFGGVLYAYIGTAESVTVPDNVREIAPDAFSGDLSEGHGYEAACRDLPVFCFKVFDVRHLQFIVDVFLYLVADVNDNERQAEIFYSEVSCWTAVSDEMSRCIDMCTKLAYELLRVDLELHG